MTKKYTIINSSIFSPLIGVHKIPQEYLRDENAKQAYAAGYMRSHGLQDEKFLKVCLTYASRSAEAESAYAAGLAMGKPDPITHREPVVAKYNRIPTWEPAAGNKVGVRGANESIPGMSEIHTGVSPALRVVTKTYLTKQKSDQK